MGMYEDTWVCMRVHVGMYEGTWVYMRVCGYT